MKLINWFSKTSLIKLPISPFTALHSRKDFSNSIRSFYVSYSYLTFSRKQLPAFHITFFVTFFLLKEREYCNPNFGIVHVTSWNVTVMPSLTFFTELGKTIWCCSAIRIPTIRPPYKLNTIVIVQKLHFLPSPYPGNASVL